MFPLISRVNSIAACIGNATQVTADSDPQQENTMCRRREGVVIVGDEAYSFPSDTGQGINAQLQDATLLMNLLDTFQVDASIDFDIRGYEAAQDEEL